MAGGEQSFPIGRVGSAGMEGERRGDDVGRPRTGSRRRRRPTGCAACTAHSRRLAEQRADVRRGRDTHRGPVHQQSRRRRRSCRRSRPSPRPVRGRGGRGCHVTIRGRPHPLPTARRDTASVRPRSVAATSAARTQTSPRRCTLAIATSDNSFAAVSVSDNSSGPVGVGAGDPDLDVRIDCGRDRLQRLDRLRRAQRDPGCRRRGPATGGRVVRSPNSAFTYPVGLNNGCSSKTCSTPSIPPGKLERAMNALRAETGQADQSAGCRSSRPARCLIPRAPAPRSRTTDSADASAGILRRPSAPVPNASTHAKSKSRHHRARIVGLPVVGWIDRRQVPKWQPWFRPRCPALGMPSTGG